MEKTSTNTLTIHTIIGKNLLCQAHNRWIQSERETNFSQIKSSQHESEKRVQEYNVKENVKGEMKAFNIVK